MLNLLYRLFLTFNSTSLLIVVFLVKENYVINLGYIHSSLPILEDYISYCIFFSFPVVLTYVSLVCARFLDIDDLKQINGKSKIAEIEQANNAFLPSYLGYFFVALSVPFCKALVFVFAVLFLFTFYSQTLYFNPLFLLFRYQFYYLTTTTRVRLFIITRKSLKNPLDVDIEKLKRINDFTYIDLEKQQ